VMTDSPNLDLVRSIYAARAAAERVAEERE
jgi:hypothetical protein